MNIKLILLLIFAVCLYKNNAQEPEDDLSDFDFDSDATNKTEALDDFENDVEYEEDKQEGDEKNQIVSKEEYVRKVILNSMKVPGMKEKVARVLPILRVMTPDQKLALATLVSTQVLAPEKSKGLSLDEVSVLFGNNPNTTAELMLPISLDIANMFRTGKSEKGPTAEELRQPYRPSESLFRRNIIDRSHPHKYYPHNSNNKKPTRPRKPANIVNSQNNKELQNCEMFTSNICLKSNDYPIDAIMASIRRNKQAMLALLADYKTMNTDVSIDGITAEQENKYNFEEGTNEIRRTGPDGGFMCPSHVKYARPQKARSTKGQWKYIVNTLEHTQTLRLEKCTNAGESCTYLNDNYKSRCVQVYNYHRLLTWDQTNGLHMDIFKVPSCCSCHIDSYKIAFPPHHANHATTVESFPGDEIEQESAHHAVEAEHVTNIITKTKTRFPQHQQHQVQQEEEVPEIYNLESVKTRPFNNAELSKFLEAPRVPTPFGKQNYNQHFKRSNTPKPATNASKRPQRPLRRRIPLKSIRDLAQSESTYTQNRVVPSTTQFTTESTTTVATRDLSKRVNYNYHPIIDFFEPDKIESRSDNFEVELGDTDWRPVTSISMMTERTQFKK